MVICLMGPLTRLKRAVHKYRMVFPSNDTYVLFPLAVLHFYYSNFAALGL